MPTTAVLESQPRSILWLYYTSTLIESFDSLLYLTNSSIMVPNRSLLSIGLARTLMRANGVARLPFYYMVFRLRGHHIRHSEVGRVVGMGFTAYQVMSAALFSWSAWAGEHTFEPLWYVVGWHVVWAAWGAWGLMRA